jgi:hypothetical protein
MPGFGDHDPVIELTKRHRKPPPVLDRPYTLSVLDGLDRLPGNYHLWREIL